MVEENWMLDLQLQVGSLLEKSYQDVFLLWFRSFTPQVYPKKTIQDVLRDFYTDVIHILTSGMQYWK